MRSQSLKCAFGAHVFNSVVRPDAKYGDAALHRPAFKLVNICSLCGALNEVGKKGRTIFYDRTKAEEAATKRNNEQTDE